jgi:branched-chain amino acid transport system ATP-binding protein
MALLSIDNVTLRFGGIRALSDVSLTVEEGQVTAIIGPNGAGKTSLLNTISGFYRPQDGRITFNGADLLATPAYGRTGLGIARTFQNIALFPGLSVIENIKLGAHSRLKTNVFQAGLYLGRARKEEAELTHEIDRDLIDLLNLTAVRDAPVEALPYGAQKRVELGRALVSNAKLLLLDEPVAGMNSAEKAEMAKAVQHCVRDLGTTVVLIEHDMQTVMSLSQHVVVLNFGQVIAAGTPDEVKVNPKVVEAYLGVSEEAR